MRFLVKHAPKDQVLSVQPGEMMDTIVRHLEYLIGLEGEGKILDSGAFAGSKGGFLVLEADSIEELDTMLCQAPGASFMNTEIHPLVDLSTRIEHVKRRKEKIGQ